MKNSILFLAILLGAAFAVEAQKSDWARLDFYAKSNAEVKAQPAQADRVVFFGNSITQIWAENRTFFADNGFIGRGIGGQTTYHFAVRFRHDVVDLNPAVVVITAGTNDVAENSDPFNLERTMGNIKSLVDMARANDIKVILTTVPPAAFFPWRKEIVDAPERIALLNERIKAYAEESGVTLVDYYSAMLADDGRSMRAEYTYDGVHSTSAGYAVMEAMILPAVHKALGK